MYYVWMTATVLFSGFVLYRHGKDLMYLYECWQQNFYSKKYQTQSQAARDFVLFSQDYARFTPGLELQVDELRDPFLKQSLKTMLAGAIRGPELLRSLRQAADEFQDEEFKIVEKLKAIQGFMPAVGWMIAMLGMAWFFLAPESGSAYTEHAGFIFSLVAATVLYGLVLTYGFIQPLINNISDSVNKNRRKNLMVIEGISHLMKSKSAFEVYEHLNLLIPTEERFELEHILPDLEARAA